MWNGKDKNTSLFKLIPVLLLNLCHNICHFISGPVLWPGSLGRCCSLKVPLGLFVVEVNTTLESGRSDWDNTTELLPIADLTMEVQELLIPLLIIWERDAPVRRWGNTAFLNLSWEDVALPNTLFISWFISAHCSKDLYRVILPRGLYRRPRVLLLLPRWPQ